MPRSTSSSSADASRASGVTPAHDLLAAQSERVRVVERTGAWLLPGLVDLHAHLREPGCEYEGRRRERPPRRGGRRLRGRLLHAEHPPGERHARRHRDARRQSARARRTVRLHPIGAITVGQKGEQLTEMADLKDGGRRRRERRRTLRDDQPRHAPRARVRRDLRPSGHPARRGPRAHRGRADARGRGRRRSSACAAGRASPKTSSSRATCSSPSTSGARYHVAHVSTMGAVRLAARGEVARHRGDRRGDAAPPAAHHEALLGYDTACKVNPAAPRAGGRRGPSPRARRRHDRLHRHRPRAPRRRSTRTSSSPRPRRG